MSDKRRVAILFGGRSAEHEVSLLSARNVIGAIDRNRYEPVLIGIGKDGRWRRYEEDQCFIYGDDPGQIALGTPSQGVTLIPGTAPTHLIDLAHGQSLGVIDTAFPVLHGPLGEDGTVQGLLELADVPYVGASVLGSSVGMDKDIMKRLLRDGGVRNAAFVIAGKDQRDHLDFDKVSRDLGTPLFIKPCNLGSSVGVNKADDEGSFNDAVHEAFRYDVKIVVEEAIQGREIECSVLGNENPRPSIPGEIVPHHAFYSYEAKYLDDDGAGLLVPAELDKETERAIQKTAIRAYKVLCCEGMARVDMFLKSNGEIYVNEINTIPGFTQISMYPRLWQASGLSYPDLITHLIELAIERHAIRQSLVTERDEKT